MDSKTAVQLIKSRVKDVFKMYDASGDGELDMNELFRAFKVLGPAFSPEDIHAFIAEIDDSGDGSATYQEFLKWVRGGTRNAKIVANAIFAAGDARAAKIKEVFSRCDAGGDGALNILEMDQMLRALGPFSPYEVKLICDDLDKSKDGEITFDEFETWMRSETGGNAIAKAKAILAPTDEDGLQGIFYNFCGSGHVDMDGSRFYRLCQDCGLTNESFTKVHVDRIWYNAKLKMKDVRRRIGFQMFEIALELVAEKKNVTVETVRAAVVKTERPTRKVDSVSEDEMERLAALNHRGRGSTSPNRGRRRRKKKNECHHHAEAGPHAASGRQQGALEGVRLINFSWQATKDPLHASIS